MMVDLLKIPRVVDCFLPNCYFIFYHMIEILYLFPKMSSVLSSSVKTKLSSLLVHCYISFMLSCK